MHNVARFGFSVLDIEVRKSQPLEWRKFMWFAYILAWFRLYNSNNTFLV